MGFGFNLFVAFIVFPLTLFLSILWIFTRKKIFIKVIAVVWISIISLVIFASVMNILFSNKNIERDDLYGDYIIDRSKFPGKQADWQYSHFRFRITKENKFTFYLTEGNKITKTHTGTVSFLESYARPRLVLHVNTPIYHIIADNPTLYYTGSSFYYVFNSPKFGNVFFVKGEWKPLDQ